MINTVITDRIDPKIKFWSSYSVVVPVSTYSLSLIFISVETVENYSINIVYKYHLGSVL